MTRSIRPKRFVLLCHQRSGSNALDSLFDHHHAIDLYGQLFNDSVEYARHNRTVLEMPLFRRHPEVARHYGLHPPFKARMDLAKAKFAPREHDLGRYMNAFWNRHEGRSAVAAHGFKLHDYQLEDDDLSELFEAHVDCAILLWRRNLLKAAVSWAYAVKTGIWVRREKNRSLPPTKLKLDEIGWFIRKTRENVLLWRRMLETSRIPWIELTYEDHVKPRRLEAVYRFLDVTPQRPEFGVERIAKLNYPHVVNANEIDAIFGAPETGFLFEDPSCAE